MMRVLWFTNTPALAEEKLTNKPVGGGWIKSLEKEIKKDKNIKLGVVFYHYENFKNFEFNGTKYYPVFSGEKNKLTNLINRIKHKIEPKEDVQKFIAIVKDFKPDIIHIHGTEGPFGLIQKKIIDIPIVISIQGNINVCKYKWYNGISSEQIGNHTHIINKILFKDISSQYKTFMKRAQREKVILEMTKNIIGRTNWDRRISSILANSSVYYHNDEILRDSFYISNWSKDLSSPLKIFTTTSNSIYKGVETIIQTAALLDKIEFKYKWHVAGLNEDEEIVKIIINSFKLKLSKNLFFEGKLDEQLLVNKLLASHVYVMPSHIENSPNNLCEAMILGMPCIATCAGGTASLLKDKKEGILIQDGDSWSLAGSIIEIFNNFNKAKEYGKNARKQALVRHNPDRIINDLINIYKEILTQ